MALLDLLKRLTRHSGPHPHPVLNQDQSVRRSFLMGIAMLAHADGQLDDREADYFFQVARVFKIEEDEARTLLNRAADPHEGDLTQLRDVLATSAKKYYFIIDLRIMAHQDGVVDEVEERVLESFAQLLDISGEEYLFMVDLAEAVISGDEQGKARWVSAFLNENPLTLANQPAAFQHYVAPGPQ